MSRTAPPPPRLLLAALLLTCANTGFVGSLGVPLVPLVREAYTVGVGAAQWSATIGLLVGAVSTPVLGRLSTGRRDRRLMCGAVAVMLAGCLLCIPSSSFAVMLGGRALQGVGMALTPLAISSARTSLPPGVFDRSVGYLAVATVTGAGLSFPVVTWVATLGGLHAAYVFGAAVAGGTLVLDLLVIPRGRPRPAVRERRPADPLGGALLVAAVGATVLVLGLGRWSSWTAAIAGAAVGAWAALLYWEARHPHPFVDLRQHLRPPQLAVNTIGALVGMGSYAAMALTSLRVQAPTDAAYGLGRSPFVAGCMVLTFSLASLAATRLLVTRLRPRVADTAILALGAALTTAGLLALALPLASVLMSTAVMCLIGLGGGCSFSVTPGIIARLVPPDANGAALSFNQLLRYLGFACGSATAGAVLELIGLAPGGHPSAAGHTTAALVCATAPLIGVLTWCWRRPRRTKQLLGRIPA